MNAAAKASPAPTVSTTSTGYDGRFDVMSRRRVRRSRDLPASPPRPATRSGRSFAAKCFDVNGSPENSWTRRSSSSLSFTTSALLQQFRHQFRGVGIRGAGSGRRILRLLSTRRESDAIRSCRGRSKRTACRSRPIRARPAEKFKIVSREIDGIISRWPRNREVRRSARPNLYLSGSGGKARGRLEEAGIEIERSNHLRGLFA